LAVGLLVVGGNPCSDVRERWMLEDLGAERRVGPDRRELFFASRPSSFARAVWGSTTVSSASVPPAANRPPSTFAMSGTSKFAPAPDRPAPERGDCERLIIHDLYRPGRPDR